jgi:hypothetical protein
MALALLFRNFLQTSGMAAFSAGSAQRLRKSALDATSGEGFAVEPMILFNP